MKKGMRIAAILLAILLACAILPPTTAQARPKSFDSSMLNRSEQSVNAKLQIGDMVFNGKLINKALSDDETDKLIEETLAEMGMTDADFDALNARVNPSPTQEELNALRDNMITLLGLPAVGASDEINLAASLLTAIDQMGQGDFSGLGKNYLNLMIQSEAMMSNPIAGYFYIKNMGQDLKDLLKSMQESYNGPRGERERTMADFYGRLNSKIYNELRKRNRLWKLEFAGATAQKPFMLLDRQTDEKWTLDMVLGQKDAAESVAADPNGSYEGDYTITIDYSLDTLPDALLESEKSWDSSSDFKLTGGGAHTAKRTLTGHAAVQLNAYGSSDISPKQNGDNKDVNISGIVIHGTVTGDSVENYDLVFSADAQNLGFNCTNHYDTEVGQIDDFSYSDAWETWSDIWKRGDNAVQGWKLTLAP